MTNIDLYEMQRIRRHFDELQGLFQRYLPNVDPDLIYDLLNRLRENPGVTPTYTLEIYTKKDVDSAKTSEFIYKIMGAMATVYDNGTHYVINQESIIRYVKEYFRFKGHYRNYGSPYYSRLLVLRLYQERRDLNIVDCIYWDNKISSMSAIGSSVSVNDK